MKDYKELICALRRCDMKQGCYNSSCKYSIGKYFCDMNKIHADAADALEELLRTRTDELNAAYRQGYDAAMMEVEKYKAFTDCSEIPNS